MSKSVDEKFNTVISKNTFYFFNQKFQEKYEGYLTSIKQTLLVIKNKIDNNGLKKIYFEQLLEKENGLRALLALTGFSNESLKRLITLIRIVDNKELSKLVLKNKWVTNESSESIKEWSDNKIQKIINTNENFKKGIVILLFEGSTIPFLARVLPLFELKKLNIEKLGFNITEMIDTLIRYKEKGSYSAKSENNPEKLIEELLKELSITFEKGDLRELINNASERKRTMDFIIPNKKNPKIIIESSFLTTTSSGQGDKSKTEITVDKLLKEHYPNAIFIGFVGGIGWYVRRNDLKRMVGAYKDVYTFHKEELIRFKQLLVKVLQND